MSSYADPSFLFSLYATDLHTPEVAAYLENAPPIWVADLVQYEFMQAARLKMFQYSHQRTIGFSREKGAAMLDQFSQDLEAGLYEQKNCDWKEVLRMANDLSARHTREHGYRSFDVLHVAAALQLKAVDFLTFDIQQQALAKAVGLQTLL